MSVNLKLEKAKLIEKIEKLDKLTSGDITVLNVLFDELKTGKTIRESPRTDFPTPRPRKVRPPKPVYPPEIAKELSEVNKLLTEARKVSSDSQLDMTKAKDQLQQAKNVIAQLNKQLERKK